MKCGNDTLDIRKYFFEVVIKNNERAQKTNNIQWIIVFKEHSKKVTLGISETGQWIFEDEKRFFVLDNKKMFLYCAKLLEIPYIAIRKQVEERFKGVLQEDISVSMIFPFFQIIEFAFSNLLSDYWFDLAWLWYIELDASDHYQLIAHLENISKTKKISQRNRQRVSRVLKGKKLDEIQ